MNDEKMKEALKTLPDSLEAMYAGALSNKIPKEYMKEARMMLIWLSYSLRPLTLQELACVVSLPEPRDVLDICTSSLVSLQRKGGRKPKPENDDEDDEDDQDDEDDNDDDMQKIVQLDHFSVQEYLTSEHLLTSKEASFFYVNPLVAHLTIAEISVSHLLKTNKVDLATGTEIEATLAEDSDAEAWRPGEDHLLDYSIDWYRHIQEADTIETNALDSKNPDSRAHLAVTESQPESQPESLRAQSHKLFCERFSQSIKNWWYLLEMERSKVWIFIRFLDKKPNSPLSIASWFDLPDNVQRLLSNGATVDGDINSNPAEITQPIQAAAIAGSLKSLRLLLEKDASLTQSEFDNIVCENLRHGPAVLSSILEARPDLAITKDTLERAWGSYKSTKMLEYILDKLDCLTETLLVEFIQKQKDLYNADYLVYKILSRGHDIGCDEQRILQAFCSDSYCRGNIKLVIDRYKPPPSKSQEIVMWVIHNRQTVNLILPVILAYYRTLGVEVEFSQDMLVQAAGSGYGAVGLFWTILGYAKMIVISKKVIREIARKKNYRGIVLNMLMDHAHCGFKNFEGVPDFAMEEHMRICPSQISHEMAKSAARWEPSAIKYLQAHARPNITFTKTLAEADDTDSETFAERQKTGNPDI